MAGVALSELPRPLRAFALVGLATVVTGAADYVYGSTGLLAVTSQGAGQAMMDWRVVDWQPYIKPMYWRLRTRILNTGTAAPGQDVYTTVYAAHASTANAGAVILDAEVAGARSQLITLTGVGTAYELTGPTFAAPADGTYVAVLHANAAWAANSGAVLVGTVDVFAR